MGKIYKQCQSCGMPMKIDKKGGGTEKKREAKQNVLQFLLRKRKIQETKYDSQRDAEIGR